MPSLTLEWGISTAGSNARWALRIRVNMSEIGSVIKSPTGLGHARNQAVERRLAERQTRAAKLAQVAVPATGHRAAVDHAARAGVPGQLRERRVILLGLQIGAQRRVFLH